MGRPRKQHSTDQHPEISNSAFDAAGEAAAAHARDITIVEKEFGIGIAYSRDLFVQRAKQIMGSMGRDSLELGLIFIQLKEREGHGHFLAVLEDLGVDPRSAQRFMLAARKFGGSEHRKQLANQLGIGKVLALIAEDDSSIDELAKGGELAGFTADEFSKMTKADVIAKLKKAREEYADEKAADEEIIRKKDERINKLSRRSTRSSRRDEINELLADLDAAKVAAASELKTMMDSIGAIEAVYNEAQEQPEEDVQQAQESALEFVNKWIHEVANRLGD